MLITWQADSTQPLQLVEPSDSQDSQEESFSDRVEHMVLSGLYDDQQLTELRTTDQQGTVIPQWTFGQHEVVLLRFQGYFFL